jgi:hypothetical protein
MVSSHMVAYCNSRYLFTKAVPCDYVSQPW